jgi:deoxycytidylate deaminase
MIEQCNNLSNRDKSFLALAMRAAEASSCNQRHGAVVVRSGSVLAIGFNKWRAERPGVALEDKELQSMSTHAEMDALSRVKNKRGVTVYVARVNKHGSEMFSRPCDDCYRNMLDNDIKRIVFTSGKTIPKNLKKR